MTTKFLIVMSDGPGGRGNRGRSLYWFLKEYAGKGAKIVRSQDLDAARPIATEYLLLGMPSNLTKEQLAGVRYKQAVLYDYSEMPGPRWQEGTETFWRGLSETYLKAWVPKG